MDIEDYKFPWNVGKGTEKERTLALIYCAIDHPNVVTRHVCRQILAEKLNKLLNRKD